MGVRKSKTLKTEEVLAFLKQHKPYLKKKFGVTEIALFGSYARSEQSAKSDIDILFECKIHDFRNRLHLQEYLQEQLQKKVDLLYFTAVRKYIMRQIEKEIIYA